VTDPVPVLYPSPLSIAPPSPTMPPKDSSTVKLDPIMVAVPDTDMPPPWPLLLLSASSMATPVRAAYSPAGTVSTAPLQLAVEQVSPPGASGPSPSTIGSLDNPGSGATVTGWLAEVPL